VSLASVPHAAQKSSLFRKGVRQNRHAAAAAAGAAGAAGAAVSSDMTYGPPIAAIKDNTRTDAQREPLFETALVVDVPLAESSSHNRGAGFVLSQRASSEGDKALAPTDASQAQRHLQAGLTLNAGGQLEPTGSDDTTKIVSPVGRGDGAVVASGEAILGPGDLVGD